MPASRSRRRSASCRVGQIMRMRGTKDASSAMPKPNSRMRCASGGRAPQSSNKETIRNSEMTMKGQSRASHVRSRMRASRLKLTRRSKRRALTFSSLGSVGALWPGREIILASSLAYRLRGQAECGEEYRRKRAAPHYRSVILGAVLLDFSLALHPIGEALGGKELVVARSWPGDRRTGAVNHHLRHEKAAVIF